MLCRCSSRAWSSSPGHGGQSRPISSQPLASLSLARSRITERRRAILRRDCGRERKLLSCRVASLKFASKSSSLAPRSWSAISLSDSRRMSFICHRLLSRYEACLYRELVRREAQRLFGENPVHAAHLEDHTPGPRDRDLPRGHPAGLHRLQGEIALRDGVARLRGPLHAAALEFAVLEALWLQH